MASVAMISVATVVFFVLGVAFRKKSASMLIVDYNMIAEETTKYDKKRLTEAMSFAMFGYAVSTFVMLVGELTDLKLAFASSIVLFFIVTIIWLMKTTKAQVN
ncbi:DUF3784 domain-containing protein [Planococcaceae bacterium Storch 2/2-2]|nr:DUF3784 domain-containing protein [Planococcaceae bacterium Storch 2/2-2]